MAVPDSVVELVASCQAASCSCKNESMLSSSFSKQAKSESVDNSLSSGLLPEESSREIPESSKALELALQVREFVSSVDWSSMSN